MRRQDAGSPFGKALNRCIMFGVAQVCGRGIAVRATIPPLARRQLLKLPPHLQQAHAEWVRGDGPTRHMVEEVNR